MDREQQPVFSTLLVAALILITACSGGGGGGQGNAKPIEYIENGELSAPESVVVLAGNQKSILYWPSVEKTSAYNLYWSTTPDVNKANGHRILAVTPGYIHNNLTNGERHYYVLTRVVGNEESFPSATQQTVPHATPIAGLFEDANLQHCVDAWSIQRGWVFADDINSKLECGFRGVSSLVGLEKLISLPHIDLSSNQLTDIAPLTKLPALQIVDLSYNNIAQIDAQFVAQIHALQGLNALYLEGNPQLDCQQLGHLITTLGAKVLDISAPQQGVNCTSYSESPPPTNSEPGDDNPEEGPGENPVDDPSDDPAPEDPPLDEGNPADNQNSPQNVIAVPGNEQITLYWDGLSDATGYTLYWSTAQPINLTSANKVENVLPGHVQTQLINQTRYYFVLTATLAGELSGKETAASDVVSAVPADQGTLVNNLFSDNALQDCVNQIANAKGWLYAHELVGNVDCSSRSIQQLQGVQALTSINSLNLLNNQIADLSPLSTLSNIKKLYLNDNVINSIESLTALTALDFLNLRNNQITDITALNNLLQLTQLFVNQNAIVDAGPLASLNELQVLDLRNNALGGANVGNIDALVTLTNATNIRLAGNSGLDCGEVITLIDALGENVVDLASTLEQINCLLAPKTPAGLTLNAGHQRILLTWEKTPRADAYHVYWSENPNIDLSSTEPIVATSASYVHNNLTNGTPYYYALTAVNSAGESPATETLSATPSLVPIAGLFVDDNLQSCVDALAQLNAWTYANEISGFVNCSAQGIAQLDGMEHLTSVTELALNQNKLNSIDTLATLTQLQTLSLYNNSLTTLTSLAGLTQLISLNLSNNQIQDIRPLAQLTALNTLDLSINRIGEQGIGDVDDLVTLSSATDIKLAGNINISCSDLQTLLDTLGQGVVDLNTPQDGVNCTASAIIPVGVSAVSGNNQITLRWNAVDAALDYRVYWATTPGVDINSAASAFATSNSYLHTGLINETTYYYIVTARRSTGEGAPSGEVASTPSASGVSIQGLFPDSALRACVESVANSKGWQLAHEITGTINCSSKNVSDLSGLEYLISLQNLRLGSNNITELTPLSGLSSIEFIDLFNNAITDITGLNGLNNLSTLYLHSNSIGDISALSGLVSLSYLILDDNNISDVTPLSSITSLQRLFLRQNDVVNINALATLTQLTHLYLNDNQVIDVAAAANLVLLQQLDFRNNQIGGLEVGNLDALAQLTNISRIYIKGNNQVSCTELDSLAAVLGPAVIDVGAANDDVNCVNP